MTEEIVMHRFIYASTAMVILLAGCATGGADDDPGSRSPSATSPSASDHEPSLSLKASPPPALGGMVTGVLGLAEIEGGCPYLEADDGTRYEVLYPDDWQLRRSPLELLDPAGEVHARSGDQVTVRGGIANDMASTCQIGPIFRATEVVTSD